MLIFFNPNHYQNEIWSNTSVLYDKHFYCFWLNAEAWKLVPRPFYDFIKMTIKQDLAICNS